MRDAGKPTSHLAILFFGSETRNRTCNWMDMSHPRPPGLAYSRPFWHDGFGDGRRNRTSATGQSIERSSQSASTTPSHLGSGRRIWTADLRVMSPTRCQAAPSRVIINSIIASKSRHVNLIRYFFVLSFWTTYKHTGMFNFFCHGPSSMALFLLCSLVFLRLHPDTTTKTTNKINANNILNRMTILSFFDDDATLIWFSISLKQSYH